MRVDNGSYGNCEACGKPISEARLEAIPTARYCIEDQAKHDRNGRRNGRYAAAADAESVAEVALPGEHDRHAQRVGGLGDLRVVLAPARVDHRAHPGIAQGLEAVRHREERVRG